MGFQYWFTVCASFLVGPITLVESFKYFRRGIYTKTFKGTSRREYIHKGHKPIEYWFSVIAHFAMGAAMLGLGFWFLDTIPIVHEWYSKVRALLHL